ncbi:serine/threonine-protein phosphatase with EF-hands 1, partial [Clonorchis sinensis]
MSLMISLSHKKRLHPRYLYKLLSEAKHVLASRPNVQKASTSISKQITVVGDLHGQLADLQTILHKNGLPDVTNPYIFNGDFVDRGRCSVETMVIILTLMLLRPTAVYLNRGNHEDYYVNCQYGFVKEIQKKYKSHAGPIVKCFTDLFRYLPLATIINDTMLVTHGGISNEMDLMVLKSLDRTAYQDLLWSDPVAQMGTRPNDLRGLGCFFGPDVSKAFLQKTNLQLLIRSHECRPEGFEWMHENRVLTIFSASNYYTEGSNKGAYAKILSDGTVHPVQFTVSGGRKHKSMRQRINSAEEAALTDLKKKIAVHSDELLKEFHAVDHDRTGQIPLSAWITAMQNVLELKLPWRTLQPRLTDTAKEKNMVLYETMFEKTKVSNSLTRAPAPLTEELYKQRDTLEGIFRAMDKDGSAAISVDSAGLFSRVYTKCEDFGGGVCDLGQAIMTLTIVRVSVGVVRCGRPLRKRMLAHHVSDKHIREHNYFGCCV